MLGDADDVAEHSELDGAAQPDWPDSAYLPAAQASQFESPVTDWKRPAAHEVQTVAPA